MYSVYAIYNKKHKKIYIGQCQDMKERLDKHNNKIYKTSYTARFDGCWIIIYEEKVSTRREALIRERQLKSYRGREFVKKFIPK